MELLPYIANVLSRFNNLKETSDGWVVGCPCPNHGGKGEDRNPSVRITIGDEGKILIICRVGCDVNEILQYAGLEYRDLYPNNDNERLEVLARPRKQLSVEEANERHEFYSKLLDQLELEDAHKEHLLERGFTEEDILCGGYKSLRASTFLDACRTLIPGFSPENYQGSVPGLREAGNATYSGLVIPVRSRTRIKALKIRRFFGTTKYIYLSDNETSSGALEHYSIFGDLKFSEFRITEGELKADICSIKSDVYTVSVPGVTNWKPLVRYLADKITPREAYWQPLKVYLAFDWRDVVEKAGVRKQLRLLVEALHSIGIDTICIEHWNELEYKGIDDLLVAGLKPEVKEGYNECVSLLESLDTPTDNLEAVQVEVNNVENKNSLGFLEAETVCSFPTEVFPPIVQDFCGLVSDGTDAPLDFPCMTALVTAASAIGSTRKIRITQGWTEFPCLYSAIVAPPGSSKSPSVSRMTRPLTRRQDASYEKWLKETDDFNNLSKAQLVNQKPIKPLLKEYFTSDTTIAAITSRLVDNPRGLLIATDEILSWIKAFGTVGMGNDQQYYLTMWSGQPLKVDRKTGERPVNWIRFPYISILGGIQPKRLPELTAQGRGEDGFLDRFLFSYPEVGDLPFWELKDYDSSIKDDQLSQGWDGIISRLYDGLTFDSKGFPEIIAMSRDNWAQSVNWYNKEIAAEIRDPLFPEYLRGFWLKLKAYYFRFALILEHIKWTQNPGNPPTSISQESLEGAYKLCSYFKCHARRVAGHASPSQELQQLEELNRIIWLGNKNGKISGKELIRLNNSIFPKKITEIRGLFITAQSYGMGTYYPEKDSQKDIFISNKQPIL
jgi:hypothetical protein